MSCRIIFIFHFLFIILSAASQVNDAGLRSNIYLEKKITQRWDIHLKFQGRINQNITRFYHGYADLGISYKVNKHIQLNFDYIFREKRSLDDSWSIRHRAYVALVLKQKVGHFSFSDRIMSQLQYSNIYSSENGMVPNYRIRNKATVKYNNASRYTYYIACELYYKINSSYKSKMPEGGQADKIRYFAGVSYELNKVNEIEFYYLIEKQFNIINPTSNFVIGIGYAHTFY